LRYKIKQNETVFKIILLILILVFNQSCCNSEEAEGRRGETEARVRG